MRHHRSEGTAGGQEAAVRRDGDETEIYRAAWSGGRTFEAFLGAVRKNSDLWDAMARRARIDEAALTRIRAVGDHWRLLVLADDWCGDAVNIVPVVAALVDAAPNAELRIVGREEYPGLMERHLTNGSRSIPVVILLDDHGRARGWWGPRPRRLQAWFEAEGRGLATGDRYRELRRRYARDRGATIAREIADLVECGAGGTDRPYRGTRPCDGLRAA